MGLRGEGEAVRRAAGRQGTDVRGVRSGRRSREATVARPSPGHATHHGAEGDPKCSVRPMVERARRFVMGTPTPNRVGLCHSGYAEAGDKEKRCTFLPRGSVRYGYTSSELASSLLAPYCLLGIERRISVPLAFRPARDRPSTVVSPHREASRGIFQASLDVKRHDRL